MIWCTGTAGPKGDSLRVVDFNKLKVRFSFLNEDPDETSASVPWSGSEKNNQNVTCINICVWQHQMKAREDLIFKQKILSHYHSKKEVLQVANVLPSTWVGPPNTGIFWAGQSDKCHNIAAQISKLKKYLHLQCNRKKCTCLNLTFYLKSDSVMAWEASFSKMRVTGRCNGWFGASNILRQWARSVETSPPSHTICRFLSDSTMAWTWCTSENWTSIES